MRWAMVWILRQPLGLTVIRGAKQVDRIIFAEPLRGEPIQIRHNGFEKFRCLLDFAAGEQSFQQDNVMAHIVSVNRHLRIALVEQSDLILGKGELLL